MKKIIVIASFVLFATFTNHVVAASAPTPDEVKQFVISNAKKFGINANVADFIVYRESQYCYRENVFEPTLLGDDGNSRGCWQISKIWHPEVSDACAFDLTCSTYWSLLNILRGRVNEWSTYKYCMKLYGYCPK